MAPATDTDSHPCTPRHGLSGGGTSKGTPKGESTPKGEYEASAKLADTAIRHTGVTHGGVVSGRAALRALPMVPRKPATAIAAYLLDRGIDSIERASALLEIPARTLRRWIGGTGRPSERKARGIAADLGEDPEVLFPNVEGVNVEDEPPFDLDLSAVFGDE